MYNITFSARGKKDYKLIQKSEFYSKTVALINLIKENPFIFPPFFEPLAGPDIQISIVVELTSNIGSFTP
jgi:Txe/YoeB family toxin of Txe-Axe toxin-antitoxin module|nr:MAG TPA: antitoxin [Bacteriophage sp.]